MNILVLGGGGREHAIAWALAKSPRTDSLYVAPGNGGTDGIAQNVPDLNPEDGQAVLAFVRENAIDFVVIGPEAPLVAGVADVLRAAGVPTFGPDAQGAQLEGSKTFSKKFMDANDIPTARYASFTDLEPALAYVRELGAPIVVKADGLALGKGVIVAQTVAEAQEAVRSMMDGRKFGQAGARVVVEECMTGPEVTVLAFCDGEHLVPMPSSQDHKRAFDGNQGPNTGGMGAISPSQAAEIDGDPAYNVSVGDSGITHFLNVNGGAFPFNDVRMREGLSLLLDRQTIIDSFYNGYGLAAGGFLNYTSAFYREQPVQHDPERGAELIREVVGDQEVELLFLLPGVDANRYPYQEEAEYIQSLLENIDGTHIKVSIQQMDWGPCKEEMEAGNYNLCLKIQGLPSANPFSLFKGFMYTEGGTNISYGLGYHNDHVDELIEEAATCLDVGRLTEIYTELQEISAVDFPNIPVLYSQEVVASSSDITGYQATVYGLTGFTQVCWAG